jgi:hypothetical protein
MGPYLGKCIANTHAKRCYFVNIRAVTPVLKIIGVHRHVKKLADKFARMPVVRNLVQPLVLPVRHLALGEIFACSYPKEPVLILGNYTRNCSHYTCPVPCGSVRLIKCVFIQILMLQNRYALVCLVINAARNFYAVATGVHQVFP